MGVTLLGMFFILIFVIILGIARLIPVLCIVFAILFWGSCVLLVLGLLFGFLSDSVRVLLVIGVYGLLAAAVVFGIACVVDIFRSFVDFLVPGNSAVVPLSAELLFFPWR